MHSSKTLFIRMLSEPSENFNTINRSMESIKTNQSEMKDTQIKIKNNVQGMNSKVGETNNQIRD